VKDGPGEFGVVAIGRNEGERLKRCLRSALAGTPRVVYVDSGSTDGSVEFARSVGVDVVALDVSRPFTAARARNAGIRRLVERWSEVEFLQVVDGDCEFEAGWFASALEYLGEHPRAAVVCGRRRERQPGLSVYNRLIDLEWDTPVGDAKACGGDAMFRREAFEVAGGYRDALIAGEEPELCVRLRSEGWQVHRLGVEMTRHDADMTRFSQFWKRAKRAGHAYAEGAAIHGKGPDRHGVKGVRSALVWGAVLPSAALVGAGAAGLLGAWSVAGTVLAAVVGLYVAQASRIGRRERARGRSPGDARLVAWFVLAAKPAQVAGIVLYWRRRLLQQQSSLIEYKAPPPGGQPEIPGGARG
jgi:GT2 family glycosyltransferase